ncbi:hypothetical protein ATO12_22240 [Aquimarina atlantica]|uniref:Uncharacterized protein n=1 Tax=Aquimarina atlantica TaxID=1317122 RepID=A0A023BS87_9FLAO|nr:hypothetical protein [Aquimarina atlantica]EZH72851.1 hypothetical protein ATO12_22240 [Aquimarina atlantica]
MKVVNTVILCLILIVSIAWIQDKPEEKKETVKQSYAEHSPTAHHEIALEVLNASKEWILAFNKGKSNTCIEGYDPKAMMSAQPFGIKRGVREITDFWQPFIQSGATNLIYTDLSIEVVNTSTALLSANWSMNVGRGVIFQEKWEKKKGKWVLTYDDFEVVEQFKTSKENKTNPIASHQMLEAVIKASIHITKGFNTQNTETFTNGYLENATMNAIPMAKLVHGKPKITQFWQKLITSGAKNLTYHNPTFRVVSPNGVKISSDWSMNIGEGKIYQEKWVKKDGTWMLSYDEFQVLKMY